MRYFTGYFLKSRNIYILCIYKVWWDTTYPQQDPIFPLTGSNILFLCTKKNAKNLHMWLFCCNFAAEFQKTHIHEKAFIDGDISLCSNV